MARHRPRPALGRPAREGDPARLQDVRRRRRRDDGERHHVPRPFGGSRDVEGAGLLAGAGGHDREAPRDVELRRVPRRRGRPRGGDGGRRLRPRAPARRALREALHARPEPAAPPRTALGRDGRGDGKAVRGRAARARGDGRARRHPVGQGRLRGPRHREGGPARPRDAGRDREDAAPDQGARGRGRGPRAPARGRPEGVRAAPRGRHDRPLPGREPRADGFAAAPRAEDLLRHRRAGRDHPAGADRGRDGAPVLRPAAGQGAGRVPAPVPRADPEAHARRAALPGAAPQDRDGGRGLHGRRGGRAAPRDGLQALGGAHGRDRRAAALGHGEKRHHGARAGPDRQVHHVVRALRLPRVARGQLRAHRVRERVAEGASPGGVHGVPPERVADGLLPPRHDREGHPAQGHGGAADRREFFGMGLPGGERREEKISANERGTRRTSRGTSRLRRCASSRG